MARHRNVRNLKNFDFDDDLEAYGQSYEDNYCVSPGTAAHYMYSRSSGKNVQLSSYISSEKPVKEVCEDVEPCENSSNGKKNIANSETTTKVKSKNKAVCVKAIQDAVGEYCSYANIEKVAADFNYNSEKAIHFLLTSNDSVLSVPNSKESRTMSSSRQKIFKMNPRTMPQTSQDKGSHFTEKSSVLSISNESTKVVKVETNSNTPVKIGFDLKVNSEHNNNAFPDQLKVNAGNTPISLRSKNESSPFPASKEDRDDNLSVNTSKSSKSLIDYKKEYFNRTETAKQQISMVVIGHVDAGKSTMMGHLLFQKGVVSDRVIHKYEQESKKVGKSSFAFAWVLDETGEERQRGVTMDVGHNYFETENRIITLMDAPGHRDFIPNMITGASQADVAVLVVGASTGEFEAGFGIGGQTREHALLVRSLGVSQLAVAVNKLDTVDWSKERFEEIVKKLKYFLKQAGFRDADVTYVPVSGLLGENLTEKSKEPSLTCWYKGPFLLQVIDKFRPPQRPIEYPFRFCVNDVYRGQGSGIFVSGKVESGGISPNTKVMVMTAGEKGLVKIIESSDDKGPLEFALSGEHVSLSLHGVEMNKINKGSVICSVDRPIKPVTRLQARAIIFNIEVPITKGFPVELHYKAVSEPATFRKLLSLLHKTTGEVLAKRPRMLKKGQNAMVEIETARAVCLEEYSNLKELGRFTLRYGGSTIAACIVTKLL